LIKKGKGIKKLPIPATCTRIIGIRNRKEKKKGIDTT
jgi:hypothetical protein